MSYVSSAGIARRAPGCGKTCRQDVLGDVDVPVVPGAAGRASPLPGGQAQVREQAAVPLALVRQPPAELAPPAVGDHAGQMPVADHTGDVEVFDQPELISAEVAAA